MKTCDYCDSDTLADDGDDFQEWRKVRDPSASDGSLIICVVCDRKAWARDRYAPASHEPKALSREATP